MSVSTPQETTTLRQDGFGSRQIERTATGRVERLHLSPCLAGPSAEQIIRARAAWLAHHAAGVVAPPLRIDRAGDALSIQSSMPEGVTLADLLAALEFGTVALPEQALLDLAGAVIRAVAALHELPGNHVHGALNPAHVLLSADGGVLLGGAMFADVLQSLNLNREQLWRTFGVAMPPSATGPRFDRRADVTQLGALVLAILLRRMITAAEYPKSVIDLIAAAKEKLSGQPSVGSRLRMWLQQAMQLHAKALFASASDAARAYNNIVPPPAARRIGITPLQQAVRWMCGYQEHEPEAPAPALSAQARPRLGADIGRQRVAGRGYAFLRNVFPASRAN